MKFIMMYVNMFINSSQIKYDEIYCKAFFVCFLLVILQFNRKNDSIQLVEFETAANKLVVKTPKSLFFYVTAPSRFIKIQ